MSIKHYYIATATIQFSICSAHIEDAKNSVREILDQGSAVDGKYILLSVEYDREKN